MPLPDKTTAWPPPAVAPLFAKMDEWSAWYSGEPSALIEHYQGHAQLPKVRPSQTAGGVVGVVGRFVWGRAAPASQPDDRLHVPLASDIFRGSADLLFAEPPSITGPDRLTEYVEAGALSKLAEGAESCAALGGVYLRVSWDEQLADAPFISLVEADGAVPEFAYDQLRAVTFWWIVEQDGARTLRHLERHELDANGNGVILHGLYLGTKEQLGTARPLTEHSSTAGLATLEGLGQDGSIPTGPGLAVEYVPNRVPNAIWRRHPLGRVLGQSDIAGSEGLLDRLDRVYSAWMRDLDKSKGRIVVPDYMLEQGRPGQGTSFDLDRDVFTGVQAGPDSAGAFNLQVVQFDFDPQKYLTTCQEIVETVLRAAGYSAQTFGEDEDGAAITATEVTSRGRRSATTRDRKLRHWQPAVQRLLQKMLVVDRLVFGQTTAKAEAENNPVSVVFAGSAQETPLALATTAKMLKDAGAASTYSLVKLVNPSWEDDEYLKETARIQAELGLGSVPDPATLGIEAPDTPTPGAPVPEGLTDDLQTTAPEGF